jgi:hypothetical protein
MSSEMRKNQHQRQRRRTGVSAPHDCFDGNYVPGSSGTGYTTITFDLSSGVHFLAATGLAGCVDDPRGPTLLAACARKGGAPEWFIRYRRRCRSFDFARDDRYETRRQGTRGSAGGGWLWVISAGSGLWLVGGWIPGGSRLRGIFRSGLCACCPGRDRAGGWCGGRRLRRE